MTTAKDLQAPFELLMQLKETGKIPVVNFAAVVVQHQLMLH
ncbi:hypothetical protein [Peribacillus frigoritolerans]|nr:hypothetical protein [Peribacillus frigoritolerans]